MNISCRYDRHHYDNSLNLKINLSLCILLNSIFVVPAILMNAIVLAILRKKLTEMSITTGLLINLAVADLTIACFSIPSNIFVLGMTIQGRYPCTFTAVSIPISFFLAIVSFTTLGFLTIDRYISFHYPLQHRRLPIKPVVWSAISVTWVLPLFPVVKTAVSQRMETMDQFIIWVGSILTCINVFCHMRIYLLVRKHRRRIAADQSRFNSTIVEKKETRLAILGALLVVSIILCYLPTICLSGLALAMGRAGRNTIGHLTYWAWTLALSNSFMNPIIKFFRLSSVRAAVIRFYTKHRHARANRVQTLTT